MSRQLLVVVVLVLMLLVSCTFASTPIAEVKQPAYVGTRVTVSGDVVTSIKIGALSGYTLRDDTGTISVASKSVPAEGSRVTASGILRTGPFLGYYIDSN